MTLRPFLETGFSFKILFLFLSQMNLEKETNQRGKKVKKGRAEMRRNSLGEGRNQSLLNYRKLKGVSEKCICASCIALLFSECLDVDNRHLED